MTTPAGRSRGVVVATYRLQIRREFGLVAASDLVPYLAELGISHLYSSPLLQARPGSTHGYDVVDPARLNRDLGTEADRITLMDALRARGLGLVLDVVPNHMAIGPDNPAWEDVLAHGRASLAAPWFDVEWDAPGRWPDGGILLPVLGDQRHRCLARGELRLIAADTGVRVTYGTQSFPIEPGSIAGVLDAIAESGVPAIATLRRRFAELPLWTTRDPDRASRRRSEAAAALAEFAHLRATDPDARRAIDTAIAAFNGPGGRLRLAALLERQPYRLVHWRRAARDLNYRRFFEVTDLIGVRVEDPAVFAAIHATTLSWVREGGVDALRIDHVDGLLDPLGYLRMLAAQVAQSGAATTPALYVEKILAHDERLPREWPVAGTTGYDFLADVDALFIDPEGLATIETAYRRRIADRPLDFATVAAEAKRRVLQSALGAECRRLARELARIVRRRNDDSVVDPAALRLAIVEVLSALPVYRSYVDQRYPEIAPADRGVLERGVGAARDRGRASSAALDTLVSVLLPPIDGPLAGDSAAARRFVQRFQQVSGPAMAKGVEDTAFYAWAPLASRNEVGVSPERPLAGAVAAFHAANVERAIRHPTGLLCTTTHDTKRSADVRARLHVLSELPEVWLDTVARWRRANAPHRTRQGRRWSPDPATEYAFYQALLGIWPLSGGCGFIAPAQVARVRGRLQAYMRKAIREAKVRTSWTEPDTAFEAAVERFVDGALADPAFLGDVATLAARIIRAGLWTALARTLFHLTAPGVPDIYQGDETWRFSLVDPDSRRPVDFARRARALAEVAALDAAPPGRRLAGIRALLDAPEDGRIKLHVIRTALAARHRAPALFAGGDYRPLRVTGQRAEHVVAFARIAPGGDTGADRAAMVIAPRLVATLSGTPTRAPLGAEVWADTRVEWPFEPPRGVELLTGMAVAAARDDDGAVVLPVAEAFAHCPAALILVPP